MFGPSWPNLIHSNKFNMIKKYSGEVRPVLQSPTKIFHVLFCLFVCINWPAYACMRHLCIIWITLAMGWSCHIHGLDLLIHITFNNKDLVYIRMFVCLLLIIEFWDMTTFEKRTKIIRNIQTQTFAAVYGFSM
jgi:hypothetical protein